MKKKLLIALLCTKIIQTNSVFNNTQAIVLAAGGSTRFKTGITKLITPICGQSMVVYPIKTIAELIKTITVVIGFQKERVKKAISDAHISNITFVEQAEQKGTGHAVLCSQHTWHAENILVMNGDMPLVTSDIIMKLFEEHQKHTAAISFVVAYNIDPNGAYGRIVEDDNGMRIVEAKHFTYTITDYPCINAGIYLINREFLENCLETIEQNEQTQEFYVTDLVEIASKNDVSIGILQVPFDTIRGVNNHRELANTEKVKKEQLIDHWMKNGVRFFNPETIQIDINVKIGAGTTIGAGTHLLGNTTVGTFCTIEQNSTLTNATIEDYAIIYANSIINNSYIGEYTQIGPFAHIRNNTIIKSHVEIGNFVEIKQSTVDEYTKAKHLSYIGDTTIGKHVNIGAGTITCNYDGKNKHKTVIEDNAFIGSNNCLVAPVTIGESAYTASGSSITENVPAKALAIARARQINKEGYDKKLHTVK